MTGLERFLHSLEEHTKATVNRSDVLRVLIWPGATLAATLGLALFAGAPTWVVVGLFTMLALLMLAYGIAFFFLLFTDRDALRSERYKIEKMAIERGLYGDNRTGLIDLSAERAKITEASPNESERAK